MLKRVGLFLVCVLALCCAPALGQEKQNPPIKDYDRFPGVSFKTEKKRLDTVAKEWALAPTRIIHLIAYSENSGKKSATNKNAAFKRLNKSEKYLNKKHNIPLEHITIQYGGIASGRMEMVILIKDSK